MATNVQLEADSRKSAEELVRETAAAIVLGTSPMRKALEDAIARRQKKLTNASQYMSEAARTAIMATVGASGEALKANSVEAAVSLLNRLKE